MEPFCSNIYKYIIVRQFLELKIFLLTHFMRKPKVYFNICYWKHKHSTRFHKSKFNEITSSQFVRKIDLKYGFLGLG